MNNKRKLYSLGVNDAEYKTQILETIISEDGTRKRVKVWICPFYRTWSDMMKRCYSTKCQNTQPTYSQCMVCEGWLHFSTFRAWMSEQDWEGKQLDKDILTVGNKLYSPETCVFVSSVVNTFMLDCKSVRGKWPIGVTWQKNCHKLKAQCSNPFTNKREYLGLYDCPAEAHKVWLARKLELAKLLAAEQDDPRVAKALVERYENYVSEINT